MGIGGRRGFVHAMLTPDGAAISRLGIPAALLNWLPYAIGLDAPPPEVALSTN